MHNKVFSLSKESIVFCRSNVHNEQLFLGRCTCLALQNPKSFLLENCMFPSGPSQNNIDSVVPDNDVRRAEYEFEEGFLTGTGTNPFG